jgi:hypothetical protein
MPSATVYWGGERIGFISDGPLSVSELLKQAELYFKGRFMLIHEGVIVDISLQVSEFGVNPVFILVEKGKRQCDENVEKMSKHPKM